jgi:homoserine kinase
LATIRVESLGKVTLDITAIFAGRSASSKFSDLFVVASLTVTVPATTANIGPGFDCLGAALALRNQFQFSLLDPNKLGSDDEPVQLIISGAKADSVKLDPKDNLLYKAFAWLYQHIGQMPPPVQIEIDINVPLARGLGSSATAIVGGLVGANALAGAPLSQEEVMQLAIALEGHPDNVVPALLGGCHLATTATDGSWVICDIPWHPEIAPILAIPNFELSTEEARKVLPPSYSRADAIFNTAHLGLLLRGLETGNPAWLKAALQDRIHQPYRQALIQGYEAVQLAAIQAGAYGLVISGAGPTLLALSSNQDAEAIAEAMSTAWANQGVSAMAKPLSLETQGAMVSGTEE